MLVIHNVDILDNLIIKKRKTKKTQILLYDTKRRSDDFINMLKYRRNGKYEGAPHFVISKNGQVYQIFNTDYSSTTFDTPKDKGIIKIAIENLGWLNKNTITGIHYNWIGDPYRLTPLLKNWRNYFWWDKYTEEQFKSISLLTNDLCEKHNIFKQVVPSQGYFKNASNFKGIVCKSNFSDIYKDINPSFNFRIFFNNEK